MTCRASFRAIAVLQSLFLLSACAATDNFHNRAVAYNEQAAVIKRNVILSNVVRSAYSMPLQYTEISSVQGQTSSTVGLSASIPFVLENAEELTGTVTPSGELSGNSNFTVTNLNTQEFYNGLLSPVDGRLLSFYLRTGYPAETLLPLVVSEIEITQGNKRVLLVNDANNESAYKTFNSALQILIESGLWMQDEASAEPVGPVLSFAQASDPRLQASLVAASEDAPKLNAVSPGRFQLQRESKSPKFCFDASRAKGEVRPGVYIGMKVPSRNPIHIPLVFDEKGVMAASIDGYVSPGLYCGAKIKMKKDPKAVNITFATRSVQGVFTYLGAIVRTELGLGGSAPKSMMLTSFRGKNYYVFHLNRGTGRSMDISFGFNGARYHVKVDPSGTDGSSRVLQLLTDLMALRSSAKNLPAPNIVSVVAQ